MAFLVVEVEKVEQQQQQHCTDALVRSTRARASAMMLVVVAWFYVDVIVIVDVVVVVYIANRVSYILYDIYFSHFLCRISVVRSTRNVSLGIGLFESQSPDNKNTLSECALARQRSYPASNAR